MRATTLLKLLLAIKHVLVKGFEIEFGALVLHVRPSWRKPRCSRCGRQRPGFDSLKPRDWRHLDFAGVTVILRYAPRRVRCPDCGVVAEQVPWSQRASSRFTSAFELAVAYLVQRCDKTSVTAIFGIAWVTVGAIVERVVDRLKPEEPLAGLKRIGVDEISFRKGHRYLTLVTNHDTGRIVWAKEGKTAQTLIGFFKELGEAGCREIDIVTIDMSAAFIKAVEEYAPGAQIVFDRFHVQQLVSTAMDKTRRQEWQRLRREVPDAAKSIKGLRWVMFKQPWNLTDEQQGRLATLQEDNSRLYRAYLLKECFGSILDRRQPTVVRKLLGGWLNWASRSRLPEFVRVGRTIRKHLDRIVAYIRYRLTNGLAEGLNNKVRLLTRRAYGFHSAAAVVGMITLCCTGIQLSPPRFQLEAPTRT